MSFHNHALGYFAQTKDVFIFFGNKDANIQNLKSSFPQFYFTRVKQNHGDQIVESNLNDDLIHSADAHITSEKNHALCVVTADCMPVLIYDHDKKIIAAIHAGWRGVANRIVPKTIEKLAKQGSRPNDFQIFIGPHIQQNSFEVDRDVKEIILKSVRSPSGELSRTIGEKYLVNLYEIMCAQLREFQTEKSAVTLLEKDTKTDQEFYSFRRDKERSGRQISFIAMKES